MKFLTSVYLLLFSLLLDLLFLLCDLLHSHDLIKSHFWQMIPMSLDISHKMYMLLHQSAVFYPEHVLSGQSSINRNLGIEILDHTRGHLVQYPVPDARNEEGVRNTTEENYRITFPHGKFILSSLQ